ncbi:hypothetical protein GGR56DRAFT_673158 [Xylariaceae sp. FL0804]|nr:hypothetical protein GGR56DRAFT_673158 [Xylariaceae sp. FL0804]
MPSISVALKRDRFGLDELAAVLVDASVPLREKLAWFVPEARRQLLDPAAEHHEGLRRMLRGWVRPDFEAAVDDPSGRQKMVVEGRDGGTPVGTLLAARKERPEDIAAAGGELAKPRKGGPYPQKDAPDYEWHLHAWAMDVEIASAMNAAKAEKLKECEGEAPCWYIEVVGVLEEARKRGLARGMVEEVKTRATTDKVPILLLGNAEACAFWHLMGFEAVHKVSYAGINAELQGPTVFRWYPKTYEK